MAGLILLAASACQVASPSTVEPIITALPPAQTATPTDTPHITVEISETPTPPPTKTPAAVSAPTATPPSPAEHRIGVRYADGIGEFYDRLTGEVFVPRGFNYVRVAPMQGPNSGFWHATLNPGFYDPDLAERALQQMHTLGYNVVRIFIDCCRSGSNAGDPKGGISYPYLENVIDFLNKARDNQIYVLMIFDLTPAEGGYDELWRQCCTQFDGENLRYLTGGGHTAERRFDRDFIRALMEQGAPMEAIFAYDLSNEVHFNIDKPPFSLASGKVATANRKSYDMALAEDKQRMMDENLVYWIDQQRASILEIDPTALVTVSFPAINSGQTTVNPQPAIQASSADFVDLHTYAGWGLNMEQYMMRFGVEGPPAKPTILGEFGASRRAFQSTEMAVKVLTEWQAQSCRYGFDGWLLWTWNVEEQGDLWHGLSENGEIAQALAPHNRPDPCAK